MFLDVGVEPHDVTEVMPDIMEIRKKESPGENSFYKDPDINQMNIQVSQGADDDQRVPARQEREWENYLGC